MYDSPVGAFLIQERMRKALLRLPPDEKGQDMIVKSPRGKVFDPFLHFLTGILSNSSGFQNFLLDNLIGLKKEFLTEVLFCISLL